MLQLPQIKSLTLDGDHISIRARFSGWYEDIKCLTLLNHVWFNRSLTLLLISVYVQQFVVENILQQMSRSYIERGSGGPRRRQ